MDRTEIMTRLAARTAAIRAKGATALFIYGSRVRGDNNPGSDLDVFVEYDATKKFSLLDLVAVKHAIEDEIGIEVDITTRDSLHPLLKEEIEGHALRVF